MSCQSCSPSLICWYVRINNIVTCRPISRYRPNYEHATIEKVWQELFYMRFAPCPLLDNGSLNIFPKKYTRGTIEDLLLGKGAVNRLCQHYRLCFPWGPCKVAIRESSSEADSCGRRRMRIEEVQSSTTEYKGISLRKEDLMDAVVTTRLL
jgi:hypothetical protein